MRGADTLRRRPEVIGGTLGGLRRSAVRRIITSMTARADEELARISSFTDVNN